MSRILNEAFLERVLRECTDWGYTTLTALECLLGEHRSRILRYTLELEKRRYLTAMGYASQVSRTSPFKGRWMYVSQKNATRFASVLPRRLKAPPQAIRHTLSGPRGIYTSSGLLVPTHYAASVVAASWTAQLLASTSLVDFTIESEYRLRSRSVSSGFAVIDPPDFAIFFEHPSVPFVRVEVELFSKGASRYNRLSEQYRRNGVPVLCIAWGGPLFDELVRRYSLNPVVRVVPFGQIAAIREALGAIGLF